MQSAIPVFIGWDRREAVAADVCKHSLLRHASVPVFPVFLKESILREIGLYSRQTQERGSIRYDRGDGRPFSTDFAFTRFLTPALSLYDGWAVFMDCDMLWRGDIAELMSLADPKYAVMCVQHRHEPKGAEKMDGQLQQRYSRKNWSSVMLFNCGHHAHRHLTVEAVNLKDGRWLHNFGWLEDHEIGALPAEWNYLVGWNTREEIPDPRIVHYTEGGPWFDAYRHGVEFADEWLAERTRIA